MKNQFTHLKAATGIDEFFVYPQRLTTLIRLPEKMKKFLEDVGVPPIESDLINLYNDESKIKAIQYKNEKYLIIGDDFGTSICIRDNTGEIYSIDQSGELFERFINSDLEKMLSCLDVYYENLEALQEVSDEEAGELVAKIKTKLQRIDAECLGNEENWWSVLLEQTELGLT